MDGRRAVSLRAENLPVLDGGLCLRPEVNVVAGYTIHHQVGKQRRQGNIKVFHWSTSFQVLNHIVYNIPESAILHKIFAIASFFRNKQKCPEV